MTVRAATITIAMVVTVAGLAAAPASAEFAGGEIDHATVNLDGFRGNQGIRTDPATVNGIGYVHPAQLDIGDPNGSFLAIGTAKGVGVDNCANDYDAKWTIYTDGELQGVYFCDDQDVDAYSAGANPGFKIVYGNCLVTGNAWELHMGNTLWRCISATSHKASRAIAMLETVGTNTDKNIDVKYTDLENNNDSSGTWHSWGTVDDLFADPNYTATQPIDTSINAYLAPLD